MNVAAKTWQRTCVRRNAPLDARLMRARAPHGDCGTDPELARVHPQCGGRVGLRHQLLPDLSRRRRRWRARAIPYLADDVWIWGGSLDEIEHTLRVGVRADHPDTRMSMMPAFGRDHLLTAQQVGDVTEYAISISAARTRLNPDRVAAARGAVVFQEQCAACHGATGAGDRNVGAPSLNDDVWLYGGSREEIRRQVELGRGGVMPSWEHRFDAGTLRALAYYVHEMGGGEPDAPPAPVPTPAAAPEPTQNGQPSTPLR
jgi:mono/diheme cytochrome c family protein